ncbi:MAG: DUF1697 domain-containing protein [Anaerolineales bacterium]
MKTFISLLRGINVSGQNKIRMPELKRLSESLNLGNVVTYIQSGNVIFDCAEQDPAYLASSIEAEITRSFGTSVRVFLRDKNRFQQIIDSNPFSNQRNEDSEKLHVTFLSDSPSESALSNLPVPADPKGSGAGNADEFLVYNKEIYLFCPNGYGRTKLSNNFFERKLSVSATTRNWKTVNALYEIANQRRP